VIQPNPGRKQRGENPKTTIVKMAFSPRSPLGRSDPLERGSRPTCFGGSPPTIEFGAYNFK
jgi:hypothetical protein